MPDWVTPTFWLSLALAGMGCTGLLLAGKGKWYGWAIGLAAQPVWAVYAVISGGYGLICTSILYGAVYWTNLARWWREEKKMSLAKHGTGEILPEPGDRAEKTASVTFDDVLDVMAALDKENQDADGAPRS